MQAITGVLTELACILYLGSKNTEIDVIIGFISLGSIAKVDDFYYSALPAENRVKGEVAPLEITMHKRQMRDSVLSKSTVGRTIQYWICRFIYKVMRIFYASYIFYFFPYTTLMAPYVFDQFRRRGP